MRKWCLMIGVCLLSGMAAAQSVKELQVFHTNDMHSRVEPFSEDYQDTLMESVLSTPTLSEEMTE